MYNKQYLSRYILVLLFIFLFVFSIDILLSHYLNKVSNSDCSVDIFSYVVSIVIFQYISCFILLTNILRAINLFCDYNQYNCQNFFQYDVGPFEGSSYTFLFFSTIPSQILLFKSDIMNGSSTTCKTEDAELLFRFSVYPFIWIPFVFYVYLSIFIIKNFLILLFNLIKEANICNSCINFSKFIILKLKFSRTKVIPIPPNEKEVQTENQISIPIASLKNEIKPFICIICMVNNIDIILEPCNHICMCMECFKKLIKKCCPCCNKDIIVQKQIYLSPLEFA